MGVTLSLELKKNGKKSVIPHVNNYFEKFLTCTI